jgi:hypothetical protein
MMDIMVTIKTVQEIQIPTKLAKQSGLFKCMIDTFGPEVIISLPSEYNNVVMVYINFLNKNYFNQDVYDISEHIEKIETSNHFCQLLKLCHYVNDDVFLNFLVDYMYGYMSGKSKHWLTYINIINELHDDIKWGIYIRYPFALAPLRFQNNQTFVDEWITHNVEINHFEQNKISDKHYVIQRCIGDTYIYIVNVYFHDDKHLDVDKINCQQVLRHDSREPYNHGITRWWTPTTYDEHGKKVKCIEAEIMYQEGIITNFTIMRVMES